MRFSYQWLKKWVNVDLDVHEFAARLTSSGLEVDRVNAVAAPFSGVVVAEIVSCEPHPNADKLKLCQVDAGDGKPVQVVCGAPNAQAGMKIPFARVGAELGEGFKIKKAKLRGLESFGMACSGKELGLSDDHSGLLSLPGDAPLGTDFREYLQLDDHSIDLELTPNRGDCLAIRGLAQDVAASCRAELTPLEISPVEASIKDRLEVSLDDEEGCPRYAGRIIRGIDPNADTPLWIVEALRRSGVRSINAVVDITNFVMLELGQPMHAFDLDSLHGSIVVRRGRNGETLVLLDENEVSVDEKMLLICDDSGPLALAGIMGGLDSGVTGKTANVFLESAWFQPATISGRARALGLHTDASHRFERGVDPMGQVQAIERLSGLLLKYTGGKAGPVTVAESVEHLPRQPTVELRLARLNRVLGSNIEAREVTEILEHLGMSVNKKDGEKDGRWMVQAPARRFDIAIEEDLIEEVARIHGYDALPATLPGGELQLATISEHQVALTQIRETMCAAGYQEAINYSFVDRALLATLKLDEHALPLANPISSDMDVMRTSLLPGLLMSLARNIRRQQDRVRMFETGVVFLQRETLDEIPRICAVACGYARPEQWGSQKRTIDFYDLKRDLESLLELRGISSSSEFKAEEFSWLHPGQCACVHIDGQPAGWAGSVHPAILAELDIQVPVMAFELDINAIQLRELPNPKNISRYPSVRRDLAFLLPEKVEYQQIRDCVTGIAGELLADLLVFDVYSGHNVEKGYKSLAIGLILQDVSCTLKDKVVDSLMFNVIEELETRLDAQHRG